MSTFFNWNGFEVDESLTFPDGQPHVKLKSIQGTIYCRLAEPVDLVRLMFLRDLAPDAPNLYISYLMAARMDRAIDGGPFSLRCVTNLINSMGFERVRVFCPHSPVSLELLNNSDADEMKEATFYDRAILRFLGEGEEARTSDEFSIVSPDKGAAARMQGSLFGKWYKNAPRVVLDKVRNVSTGRITGLEHCEGEVRPTCIILDDLCDGGATFCAAADVLRSKGAEHVHLAVCHGIFSKGTPIMGIDSIATTNSFRGRLSGPGLKVFPMFQGTEQ